MNQVEELCQCVYLTAGLTPEHSLFKHNPNVQKKDQVKLKELIKDH